MLDNVKCPSSSGLLTVMRFAIMFSAMLLATQPAVTFADYKGEMDLQVIDAETREPLAVRFRITNWRNRSPSIRKIPRLGDDFTFRDKLTFKMPTGKYRFSVEHGPHYKRLSGTLDVDRDGFDVKQLVLPRFVNLEKEGWHGGDIFINRKLDQLPLLMEAEDLKFSVIASWAPQVPFTDFQIKRDRSIQKQENKIDSVVDHSAGLLKSSDGRLLAVNMTRGIEPAAYPNDSLGFAQAVKQNGGLVVVLDANHSDLPMLIAHRVIDCIAILNDTQRMEGDRDRVAFGRPPNDRRFDVSGGLGRYNQAIYFHLLNCGVRIPPAAFSASGDCDNPPGFNRVYVACGLDFSGPEWWKQLQAGRCLVSNGPLLRTKVNGYLPGHVFEVDKGDSISLEIACKLATRDKVDYLEIIKDGLIQETVRLEEWATKNGKLPLITFDRSGWLAVRAVCSAIDEGYRYAMSAPFYVSVGESAGEQSLENSEHGDSNQRVNKKSAEFFRDWVYQRAKHLRKQRLPASVLKQRIAEQRVARDYWQRLADGTAQERD